VRPNRRRTQPQANARIGGLPEIDPVERQQGGVMEQVIAAGAAGISTTGGSSLPPPQPMRIAEATPTTQRSLDRMFVS